MPAAMGGEGVDGVKRQIVRMGSWLVVGIGMVGMFSGCAMQSEVVDLDSEVTTLKEDLRTTNTQVDALQKKQGSGEITSLQRRVEAAENYFKEKTAMTQRSQADQGTRMDQILADLQVIQGKMEENNQILSELSQRVDEQAGQVDELTRRVGTMESKRAAEPPPVVVLPGGQPEPPKQTPDKPEDKAGPSDIYNQAYRNFLEGSYDLAITGFSSYLQRYPAGSLAPNAQYWIGESHYGKKDYAQAVEAFEKVSVQYPKNDKVPSALLKAGYAYLALGNGELARTYLKRVVEQYPYSREATLAKVKLAETKE